MSKDEERRGLDDDDNNKDGRQKSRKKKTIIHRADCSGGSCNNKKNRNGWFYENSSNNMNGSTLSYVPSLSDEVALLILARVPRSEYHKLCFVNRRYRSLMRSGELYAVRRSMGIKEPSVLMLASGEHHWWSYDPRSSSQRNLPTLPCDSCFSSFDKESICAGTHLLVSGKELGGSVIWRYELVSDQWFKGPHMIRPRCLFASANCGTVACIAGGIGSVSGSKPEVLNTAEIYDPEKKTWSELPRMRQRRKLCSGCYMENKFYVIGGQNDKGENLTCGEIYDLEKHCWESIPNMIKDVPSWSSRSPPLIAVASNELYSLEASSNQLRVYIKKSNSWKDLGEVPVRADRSRGWGVAFKSLGDELLVIGGGSSAADTYTCRGMTICTCRPEPSSASLEWKVLASNGDQWSSFIFNCSIMLA